MERIFAIFLRAWIALAIAVTLIALASLFMPEGSSWAITRRFAGMLFAPAIGAYGWLHRHRNLVTK